MSLWVGCWLLKMWAPPNYCSSFPIKNHHFWMMCLRKAAIFREFLRLLVIFSCLRVSFRQTLVIVGTKCLVPTQCLYTDDGWNIPMHLSHLRVASYGGCKIQQLMLSTKVLDWEDWPVRLPWGRHVGMSWWMIPKIMSTINTTITCGLLFYFEDCYTVVFAWII
jgi:hypothetical protein